MQMVRLGAMVLPTALAGAYGGLLCRRAHVLCRLWSPAVADRRNCVHPGRIRALCQHQVNACSPSHWRKTLRAEQNRDSVGRVTESES
jgi:hypothetical protein